MIYVAFSIFNDKTLYVRKAASTIKPVPELNNTTDMMNKPNQEV